LVLTGDIMFRIRTIHTAGLPGQKERIRQVQEIFRENFPELARYADGIPEMLDHSFMRGFRSIVLTAETSLGVVNGFVLLLHFPSINYSFIDFIAVRAGKAGGGIGGALYEAAREYCLGVHSRGLFLEVDPDDDLSGTAADKARRIRQRLRFYELYDVRPIVNTLYDEPVGDPPTRAFLLFDGLRRSAPLRRGDARAAVRYILGHRFGHTYTNERIERIASSFRDDPVRFRAFRYIRPSDRIPEIATGRLERPFILVVSPRHEIHHVKSRGYVERPARVVALVETLNKTGLFTGVPVRHFSREYITAVHDRYFVRFLKTVCMRLSGDRPVYPDTFPLRRPERRPKDRPEQAGYYCIDSTTPLDRNAYLAARGAVDAVLTAASEVMSGAAVAYALVRPPGHHAERKTYGGFCYFNNAAIAADYLSREGRVALLDIDFHHGNGTQDIFYHRSDVLFTSIHGNPDFAYPYFSGFADETGTGEGAGFNRNFPLPAGTGDELYLQTFGKAISLIRRFRPGFLVVSIGFDSIRGDPTGSFNLSARAFDRMGEEIGSLEKPTLVVQEGGYNLRNLRRGAVGFFSGLSRRLARP
jgi:acetoin utilization deacetylase AcuC-like enzyme/GNAT superfamily N-acetyltransferase